MGPMNGCDAEQGVNAVELMRVPLLQTRVTPQWAT